MPDDQVEAKNKGGRPPFKPTKAHKEKVILLVSCRTSEEVIAGIIGIDRGTLRDHFAYELDHGRHQFRLELRKKLKELADKGNVSALKYLDATAGDDVPAAAEALLGKKEAAKIAAKNPEPGTPLGDLMRRRQEQQEMPGPGGIDGKGGPGGIDGKGGWRRTEVLGNPPGAQVGYFVDKDGKGVPMRVGGLKQ